MSTKSTKWEIIKDTKKCVLWFKIKHLRDNTYATINIMTVIVLGISYNLLSVKRILRKTVIEDKMRLKK